MCAEKLPPQEHLPQTEIGFNEEIIRGIGVQIERLKDLMHGTARKETIEFLEQARARLQKEVDEMTQRRKPEGQG